MKMEPIIDWAAVQRRLAVIGFDPGPADGVRGPKTDAAIVAFKRSIGLRARPYLGPKTLAALMGGRRATAKAELPWMAEAALVRGLHEVRDHSRLTRWMGAAYGRYDWRSVPWCGAFVATCFRQWSPDIDLPDNPLGARNWQKFGVEVRPQFGAVLVFWRGSRSGWKGHVGFYHGEDRTHYHVLGGNQSNAVTVSRIAKSRLLSAQWPHGVPQSGKQIVADAAGVTVTSNEA